jgi:hypothetical protein
MRDSIPNVPPQFRFPNRLEKVRRLGVAIARLEGEFGPRYGRGCLRQARLNNFWIGYFNPFNQPTGLEFIDWGNNQVRTRLHGLFISSTRGSCLDVYWEEPVSRSDGDEYELNKPELGVRSFFEFSVDHWDRRFGRTFYSRQLKRAEFEEQFKK